MKKLLLFVVCIAALGIPVTAAPCVPGTLASYMAMGTSGCELGNVQVAGFAYQAKSGGGAAEITADQIQVTPLLAPVTGTYGLEFAAPWSVQAGQTQGSNISYHVLSAAAAVQVQQARLDGSGFKAGLMGSVVVNESIATGATTHSLQAYLKCTEVCHSQTSAQLTFTPPVGTLVVADVVTLQSKQGAASMTSFTDWFVVNV